VKQAPLAILALFDLSFRAASPEDLHCGPADAQVLEIRANVPGTF
jgi:hypothetical protein